MAMHLLEGLFFGMQNSQRHRRRAGAAAGARLAVRRADPRAEQPGRRRRPGHRGAARAGRRDAAQAGHARRRARSTRQALPSLVKLQEAAVERVAKAPKLSPMEATDPRTSSATGWRSTASPAAGSWRRRFVAGRARRGLAGAGAVGLVPGDAAEPAVRWLAYTVETELLMNEIEDATTRVSTLVGAAKQYSQMDRAPFQVVDVHELLDRTLVMLGRQARRRDHAWSRTTTAALPPIPAYAGRAQPGVDEPDRQRGRTRWTATGTLTVRTAREDDCVVVEIGDTGPGIPADDPGPDLRAVLHHQAGRRGHRARPGHLLADRGQQAPRRHPGALRARRHPLPGAAAADRARPARPMPAAVEGIDD